MDFLILLNFKIMKKLKSYCILLAITFSSAVFAQGNKKIEDSARIAKMEEMKQLRHDLFVKKLSLTDAESKAFFPIYDEYQLKLRDARKEFRKKWKGKKPEELSETEADEYLSDAIAMREKEVALFKTYSEKL